ncbi:MAG: MerR family transcriptional regulator [Pseudomonadaceae bacterium]|nr:MerR family transcriptional regulator [Pseudomonadaceae bacterium]
MTELDDDLYRIGTAAKLTGLSVERLRAWERRFDLVPAHRSGKIRFYSRDQIERLSKIRGLIDTGHSVSSVIDLDDEQLDNRLQAKPAAKPTSGGRLQPRVALIGPNLLLAEQKLGSWDEVDVIGRWSNLDALSAEAPLLADADAVVIQSGALSEALLDSLADNFEPESVVLLYQYGLPALKRRALSAGYQTLQWPADWAAISAAVNTCFSARALSTDIQSRHFSDEELIAIASASTTETEIPNHLVDIVMSLNGLVEFAAQCQRSDTEDDDVSLATSARQASQARALLEQALEGWIEQDMQEEEVGFSGKTT